MKNRKIITILVFFIIMASIIATSNAIFSTQGSGSYDYQSIRGKIVSIYGKGLYQHMSADVAIQGIAQDYVTLLLGVPLLLISLFLARKNYLRGLFLLSGTLAYFLVTYLFYLAMAMYNQVFLIYVLLLGTSFFAFILTLFSYEVKRLSAISQSEKIFRAAGWFLIANASLVGLLWLKIIVPPLLDGSIIPAEVQHYTTLIVQGFDLGLLLPMAIVSGIMAVKKHSLGYFYTFIYVIFLSLLMTALSAKILFMASAGANVIPAVFIMPTINIIAIIFSILLLRNIKSETKIQVEN